MLKVSMFCVEIIFYSNAVVIVGNNLEGLYKN